MRLPFGRLRVEKRPEPSRLAFLAGPPASILMGLAAAGLFLAAVGADPAAAGRELFLGAFGGAHAVQGTLLKAIPLALCGLGLSIAFRMNLWNIGAEGQLHLGAAAAAWFALSFPGAPSAAALPAMGALAMLAGGIWSMAAGLLKAWWGVSEIIVTLMLNYVAILWVEYLVYVPWRDPQTHGFPFTPYFAEGARLPVIAGRVHLGLAMALAAAAALQLFFARARAGFDIRVAGANPRAARYAGLDLGRMIPAVMFASGALAGLAGMSEVAGLHHRLQPDFSPGYGYTAIIVAWLGNLHPLIVPVAALLFGGLLTGGDMIQITLRMPVSLIFVLQGLILFFFLAGEFLRGYAVRWRKGAGDD